jgi:hypothetical protein
MCACIPGIGITQNSDMNTGSDGNCVCELNCQIYAAMNNPMVEAINLARIKNLLSV